PHFLVKVGFDQTLNKAVDGQADVGARLARIDPAVTKSDRLAGAVALEIDRAWFTAKEVVGVGLDAGKAGMIATEEADQGRGDVALRIKAPGGPNHFDAGKAQAA